MKKTKLFGLTALLLSLGLSGCVGVGDPGNNNNGKGNTKTTTPVDGELEWVGTAETHYQVDAKGNKQSEPAPHELVDYAGDANHVNKPATCKSPGIVYKQCSVCKKIVSVELARLKHNYEEVDSDNPATCTKAGEIKKVCSLCGDTITETANEPLGHHLVEAATGKTGVSKSACDRNNCGYVEYVLDVAQATGWNKATTKMNGKTSPDNQSSWDVAGVIDDGHYDIQIEGLMSYTSHGDRYWYNMYETDTASSPDKSTEDPFRYFFKVNDSTINPNVLDKTWKDLGYLGENDSGTPVFGDVCKNVEITGANTFSLMHGNIGFSMIISKVKLIKVIDAE